MFLILNKFGFQRLKRNCGFVLICLIGFILDSLHLKLQQTTSMDFSLFLEQQISLIFSSVNILCYGMLIIS